MVDPSIRGVHDHPALTAYPAAPLDHAEISSEVGAATRAFAKLPGKGFRGGIAFEVRRRRRTDKGGAGRIVGKSWRARGAAARVLTPPARRCPHPHHAPP